MTRRLGSLTVLGAVALGAAVMPPAPARAATTWTFTDKMEIQGSSQPQDRFDFDRGGTGGQAVFVDAPATAHSPVHSALLTGDVQTQWRSVGRMIHLTPVANGELPLCTFSAWTVSGMNYFNIEVINPVNWSYVAVRRVRGENWLWTNMATGTFQPWFTDLYFRVSMSTPHDFVIGGYVDDFRVTCTY